MLGYPYQRHKAVNFLVLQGSFILRFDCAVVVFSTIMWIGPCRASTS